MATKIKLKGKNGNGKKSILTSKSKVNCNNFLIKAKLAMYMKGGLDIKDASKLCNVSGYQLGQLRSDPEFEEFIEYCSANCELEHLGNITDAGSLGQWQASAWILERKFPEKYSKRDTVRHEYEVKLMSFRKIMLSIINELDPNVRHLFMQKLRNINVESEVEEVKMGGAKLIEMDSTV